MDFEKEYGEALIILDDQKDIGLESIKSTLKEVSLDVEKNHIVVLKDKKSNITFANENGLFCLVPNMDYVILRNTKDNIASIIEKQEEIARKEVDRKAKADVVVSSFAKRDFLHAIEQKIQEKWEKEKIFEFDAPEQHSSNIKKDSFFATFPYPYMNGKLHLGHSFSLSKVEFATRYQRLRGKNSLFPFGFHCTGMPIKAASDKLRYEMETFGNPPKFLSKQESTTIRIFVQDNEKRMKVGKSNRGKVAKKATGSIYQWEIMESIGIGPSEIPNFSNPEYWIHYFPPIAINDLKRLGLGVDWRRSFITTNLNPYYDSFVRWQFFKLKEQGRIKFGKRNTIYSPKDNGPCMDHDRHSGEGVVPKEYTLIKLKLLKPFPKLLDNLEKDVYLISATLRPETMYGQTNIWVHPGGSYGAFEMKQGKIFVCSLHAARNMAYQDLTDEWGVVKQICTIEGQDLIGCRVKAPLTSYNEIYVLPMLSVSVKKGTGIVSSVPSDSPDDYVALRDLVEKSGLRAKFNVSEDMVLPFKAIPIIDTPGYGNFIAEVISNNLKIKSQNDHILLQRAKEETYLKSFYSAVLIVGEYAGCKIEDVKLKIRNQLISSDQALLYSEPSSEVISRSGDECVVALIDQWYIDYGEEKWREQAFKCIANMSFFCEETRMMFEKGLNWMNAWACSRSYGLGTRIPWDEQFLIESLSDSTIYMAYYTVCHYLHSDLEGKVRGIGNIAPEQMTPDVWSFIFNGKELPAESTNCGGNKNDSIDKKVLERMRNEFLYWYPVDLRASGKDLVNNHLLFYIYNHVALFDASQWPRAVRANGHSLLNKAKMSKSTGNFITIQEAIERYSADGMRFALADAGDSLDDANFSTESADGALLKLYTQIEWIRDILNSQSKLRSGEYGFLDRVFENQINRAISLTEKSYGNMDYKEGVKNGFFDLQNYRDNYQDMLKVEGIPLHLDLLKKFIGIQAQLLAPICPHWAEYIWTEILKNPESIFSSQWPEALAIDRKLFQQYEYLNKNLHAWRVKIQNYQKPKKGSKPPPPENASIVVAKKYPEWHEEVIRLLKIIFENNNNKPPTSEVILQNVKEHPLLKKDIKKAIPIMKNLVDSYEEVGDEIFNLESPWDEIEILKETKFYISKSIGISNVDIYSTDDSNKFSIEKIQSAVPGSPVLILT